MRREVFGEDIGQQGWRTATEQAEIAELLGIGRSSRVLDVCCGSGGPSLALAQRTGCRIDGIDREIAGIAHAQTHASARGLSDRAAFALVDCAGPLPFEEGSFDAVLCIDAIPHLPDRFGTLRKWSRLLGQGASTLAILMCSAVPIAFGILARNGFVSRHRYCEWSKPHSGNGIYGVTPFNWARATGIGVAAGSCYCAGTSAICIAVLLPLACADAVGAKIFTLSAPGQL